jgi:hypothetical protein
MLKREAFAFLFGSAKSMATPKYNKKSFFQIDYNFPSDQIIIILKKYKRRLKRQIYKKLDINAELDVFMHYCLIKIEGVFKNDQTILH